MGKQTIIGLAMLLVVVSLSACDSDSAGNAVVNPTSTLGASGGASTSTPAAVTPTNSPAANSGDTPTASNGSGKLTVYAAASLKDSFTRFSADFKASSGNDTTFNFAGSQLLVTQLQSGAQADVLVTADLPTMQAAISASLVTKDSEQELATNSLVVILPPQNPANIQSIKDLANPGVKIDIAADAVPVGKYAQLALTRLSAEYGYGRDFKDKVNANVVSREDNVSAVVAKVQLGEADAGFVYSTDATAAQSGPVAHMPLKTIAIPANDNPLAVYYIAKLNGAANPSAADLFIKYVVSGKGRDTLASFGFGHPRPMNEPLRKR